MPEQAPEHVAAQTDTLIRQPPDQAVQGLATRRGIEFQAATTQLNDMVVFDDDCRFRDTLWRGRTEALRRTRDRVHNLVDPRESRVVRPESRKQVVVALPRLPISL